MLYLAIPNLIPILGYADDAIIVTVVLLGVVHQAGIGWSAHISPARMTDSPPSSG